MKIRCTPYAQSISSPSVMYSELDCLGVYPFDDAIRLPIATSAAWSSAVMSDGMSVFV